MKKNILDNGLRFVIIAFTMVVFSISAYSDSNSSKPPPGIAINVTAIHISETGNCIQIWCQIVQQITNAPIKVNDYSWQSFNEKTGVFSTVNNATTPGYLNQTQNLYVLTIPSTKPGVYLINITGEADQYTPPTTGLKASKVIVVPDPKETDYKGEV